MMAMAIPIPMPAVGESGKGAVGRARLARPRPAHAHGGDRNTAAQLAVSTAELAELTDTELQRLAAALRAQALRGVREANGPAHACEAALRNRRSGSSDAGPRTSVRPALDLRPLAEWDEARPWWRFW